MATVTLPVFSRDVRGLHERSFQIDKLSFTRSIVRQGMGARAAWRKQFASLSEIPQSHAVQQWDTIRREIRSMGLTNNRLSERRNHRAWLPVEEQAPSYSDDKPIPDFPHGDAGTLSDDTPAPGADDI